MLRRTNIMKFINNNSNGFGFGIHARISAIEGRTEHPSVEIGELIESSVIPEINQGNEDLQSDSEGEDSQSDSDGEEIEYGLWPSDVNSQSGEGFRGIPADYDYNNENILGALSNAAEVVGLVTDAVIFQNPNHQGELDLPFQAIGESIGWEFAINGNLRNEPWIPNSAEFDSSDVEAALSAPTLDSSSYIATFQLALATVGLLLLGNDISMVILD